MIIAEVLVTMKTTRNFSKMRFGTMGNIYMLLVTVAWATTAMVMRKYLKGVNAGVISFYRYTVASVIFVAYLLFRSSLVVANMYQVLVGVVVGVGTLL